MPISHPERYPKVQFMQFQKIAWVVIGSPNHKAAFRIALRLLYTVQDTHCSPPEAGKETTGTSSIAKFSDNLSVRMRNLELLSLYMKMLS